MKKEQAEEEKSMYFTLKGKILTHKIYKRKMQVLDIGVAEIAPKTKQFYVSCRLKGDLGEVSETLEYVLKNYKVE